MWAAKGGSILVGGPDPDLLVPAQLFLAAGLVGLHALVKEQGGLLGSIGGSLAYAAILLSAINTPYSLFFAEAELQPPFPFNVTYFTGGPRHLRRAGIPRARRSADGDLLSPLEDPATGPRPVGSPTRMGPRTRSSRSSGCAARAHLDPVRVYALVGQGGAAPAQHTREVTPSLISVYQ
jgi:hypothetical protein